MNWLTKLMFSILRTYNGGWLLVQKKKINENHFLHVKIEFIPFAGHSLPWINVAHL